MRKWGNKCQSRGGGFLDKDREYHDFKQYKIEQRIGRRNHQSFSENFHRNWTPDKYGFYAKDVIFLVV